MTTGNGATLANHLPDIPFEVDPLGFAQRTRKNIRPRGSQAHSAGSYVSFKVPQSGVLARIRLFFDGQVTVSQSPDADIAWTDWPYGLLERFTLRLSGANELWSCPGTALQALRHVRYPAYEDGVDDYPGQLGGGGSTVVDGTYDMFLTYDVVIPVDLSTLGASIFMQSAAIDADVRLDLASNPAGLTVTGTWHFEPMMFDVPWSDSGALIVPDVTRLHGVNETSMAFAGPGEQEMTLIRSSGQLHRLMFQIDGAAKRLSADPAAAANEALDAVRLEYGGNQVPYNFDPATSLLVDNNQAYGAPCPFRYLVLDLVRENTTRDPIELQGVTDLRLIPTVGASVSATSGRIRAISETLF